jgi:hypothetical protein
LFNTVMALGYVRREANHTGAELLLQTADGKIQGRIVESA